MASPVWRDHALTLLSSPAAKTKLDDGSTQNPFVKASVYNCRWGARELTRFWECVLTWPVSVMTGRGDGASEELPLDLTEDRDSGLDPAPQNRTSYKASYR
jgi:hypothetical protein